MRFQPLLEVSCLEIPLELLFEVFGEYLRSFLEHLVEEFGTARAPLLAQMRWLECTQKLMHRRHAERSFDPRKLRHMLVMDVCMWVFQLLLRLRELGPCGVPYLLPQPLLQLLFRARLGRV